MSNSPNFAEAFSECLTWRAYFTYDSKYELGQAVSQDALDAADIVASLGQSIDEVPASMLREAEQRLVALGHEEFEQHLQMSFAQIYSGRFRPTNATDYLQSFNLALAAKFGPLVVEKNAEAASAVLLQFCNRDQ